ncbi:MAG: hypothetical protein ACE5IR_11245, partial [bacterium]
FLTNEETFPRGSLFGSIASASKDRLQRGGLRPSPNAPFLLERSTPIVALPEPGKPIGFHPIG